MKAGPQQFYRDTFIRVAPDSTATTGRVPPMRGGVPTVPLIEYELLSRQPYKLTQHDLIFETHVRRKGISEKDAKTRRDAIWKELFQKSHPCMRASLLPKKYGWGVHYDARGRIALHAVDSPAYAEFTGPDSGLVLVSAMRQSRKKS